MRSRRRLRVVRPRLRVGDEPGRAEDLAPIHGIYLIADASQVVHIEEVVADGRPHPRRDTPPGIESDLWNDGEIAMVELASIRRLCQNATRESLRRGRRPRIDDHRRALHLDRFVDAAE